MNSKKQWTSMFIKTSSGNQLPETSDSSTMRLPYSEPGETISHNPALERERERETSQPKGRTRWNPKPEQVRILEAIYQSGVVSPPREEIKRIRAQLQVFGEVGDASVFYWFQNRKSRSKRKPRLPATQRSKSRTQSGTLSSTSSTSTSASVNSKTVTEIYNSSPNSMHSNTSGHQYYSTSTVPVSSFAENDYNMHALYEEMSKTSPSVPTKTLPNPSNSPANANNGDQYCFSSAPHAPLYSSAGNNYDHLQTSTFAPSQTLLNSSNSPLNFMPANNIRDQYCFSPAHAPLYSSDGNDYDHLQTSTSAPSETLRIHSSNSPLNAMPNNIGDQYCFSPAASVYSSAGHHYDLPTLYDEMSNINELRNMQQVIEAPAAAEGQSILNEGIGGVQLEGSIINPNPSITVFINDVPTTIPSGPINFRDFFGNDGLLLHSSGESVLVNEFGLTTLEHGATYFLI